MITLEFDEHGNVVRPAKPKSESFHYKDVMQHKAKEQAPPTTNHQLANLKSEHASLLLQRNKLSTSIAPTVEAIRQQLLKESPEKAAAFMCGDLRMPEMQTLRSKIDGIQSQMAEVFEKIEHLEKYGELPAPEPVTKNESETIKAMRHDLRCLNDLICKLNRKLTDGGIKPKNSNRRLEWAEKKSLAEATREELKHKIKRMEYEGRNRTAQAN